MKHNEGHFSGADNWQLYYQSWHPEEPAKAVLAIVHGIGEHSGRYDNVVNALVPQGYAVYGFDHRGHGRSPDKHCAHVNDWSEFREDVGLFLAMITTREPTLPLFLMGHSMGGLIVTEYVLRHPDGLTGVIASAPAIGKVDVPAAILFIGRILSRLSPSFSLETGLDVNSISRDEAVVAAYTADPFVHGRATARFSTEFSKAGQWVQANAAKWSVPLLIVHGAADSLVPPVSSEEFFSKISYGDKELILYPEGFHESHNDIHQEQVMADFIRWLDAHMPK